MPRTHTDNRVYVYQHLKLTFRNSWIVQGIVGWTVLERVETALFPGKTAFTVIPMIDRKS